MSIGGAIGKLLVTAAGEVLLDVAKRAVSAVQERLRPKPPAEVPPPIDKDKYTAGMFDGIDRARSAALGREMAERARQQPKDWSDD